MHLKGNQRYPRQAYQTEPTKYCERLVLCMQGIFDTFKLLRSDSHDRALIILDFRSWIILKLPRILLYTPEMIKVVIVLRTSDLIPKIELC